MPMYTWRINEEDWRYSSIGKWRISFAIVCVRWPVAMVGRIPGWLPAGDSLGLDSTSPRVAPRLSPRVAEINNTWHQGFLCHKQHLCPHHWHTITTTNNLFMHDDTKKEKKHLLTAKCETHIKVPSGELYISCFLSQKFLMSKVGNPE